MTDKKFDYSGYYYSDTMVYKVTEKDDGSLTAEAYVPRKGFQKIKNPREVLLDGEKISKEEFEKYAKFEDSLFQKQQKSRD